MIGDKRYSPRPYNHAQGKPFQPFLIQDPFNLRKAVVPVFLEENSADLWGAGTAFRVGTGQLLCTASHVLSDVPIENSATRPLVLLGIGMVFGQVGVPAGALAPIRESHTISFEKDDPIAALQGRSQRQFASDITLLKMDATAPDKMRGTLDLSLEASIPSQGDVVLAVGFPEISCQKMDIAKLGFLLSEGMYGAYGIVKGVHPLGRGTLNPTPVIEVEANWPSGMSGGPVFNSAGKIVGLVSRSMLGEQGEVGTGYAACFGYSKWIADKIRTIS